MSRSNLLELIGECQRLLKKALIPRLSAKQAWPEKNMHIQIITHTQYQDQAEQSTTEYMLRNGCGTALGKPAHNIVHLPSGIEPRSLLLESISLSSATLLDRLDINSDKAIISFTSAAVKVSD